MLIPAAMMCSAIAIAMLCSAMAQAIGEEFLDRVAEKAVTAAGMASAPRIFPLMPQAAKRKLVEQARESTSRIMRGVLADLKAEAIA